VIIGVMCAMVRLLRGHKRFLSMDSGGTKPKEGYVCVCVVS